MDGGIPVSRASEPGASRCAVQDVEFMHCAPSGSGWGGRQQEGQGDADIYWLCRKILAQEIPKSRRSSLARSAVRGGLQFNRAHILIEEIGNVRLSWT